jgi:aspartate/methionine/tyrosine aminotransferase
MTIKELLSLEPGSNKGLEKIWLGYTEPSGAPSLREAITSVYAGIESSEVLVHSGAEEAIFNFMHATLQPGDHIIVHAPCYQSLEAVALSIGCAVTHWHADPENGWGLDVEQLEGMIRPNTRAVVINTPHNPTGYLMSKKDFRRVCRMTEDLGITLFSDEVYRGLEYDPEDKLPAACDISDKAVSLGVMSKTYGLPGLRIGWIATRNDDVRKKMEIMKDYTTICCSAPSEYLAEVALRHHESLAERNRKIIGGNLLLLDKFFSKHTDKFAWLRPKAGPIAFPRLIDGDVEGFCDDLVKRTGVLLLPGTVYDERGNHFRIGFGRRNMPEALQLLENSLNDK